MRDKHKVTLYITSELHRKLKIKAAVEAEPMSAIAERAICFYLTHADVVDEVESSQGQAHRVYSCPECDTDLLFREGDVVRMNEQPTVVDDDDLDIGCSVSEADHAAQFERHDREELVPC